MIIIIINIIIIRIRIIIIIIIISRNYTWHCCSSPVQKSTEQRGAAPSGEK